MTKDTKTNLIGLCCYLAISVTGLLLLIFYLLRAGIEQNGY